MLNVQTCGKVWNSSHVLLWQRIVDVVITLEKLQNPGPNVSCVTVDIVIVSIIFTYR
jgi:hypothetical protein